MTQQIATDAQVREAAYLMWLEEGQPEGRDQAHWLMAIDALNTPAPKAKAKRKPATKRAAPKAAAKAAAKPKAKAKKAQVTKKT